MFLSSAVGISSRFAELPPDSPHDIEVDSRLQSSGPTQLGGFRTAQLAASSSDSAAEQEADVNVVEASTFAAAPNPNSHPSPPNSTHHISPCAAQGALNKPINKPTSNADVSFLQAPSNPTHPSPSLSARANATRPAAPQPHEQRHSPQQNQQTQQNQQNLAEIANKPRQRYALHKRLCHSIYGEVYMGTDKTTNRRVAVKVSVRELLRQHISRNDVKVMEDPTHEAAIMKLVSGHRCIVRLVDTHEDETLHWLVQEFVPGGELFDLVVKYGHLPDEYARRFFQFLLSAMHHMHSRGVCHLDLSLENLLIDQEGYLKVCDFGLARTFTPGKPFPASQECKPGKLNYMAPEILAGKEFEGPKADLFSAGVILFTMLTGHPPFQAASADDERYKMIATGQIGSLLMLLRMTDRVNVAARDLLTRLLHPDPAKRLTAEKIAAHPWVKGAI